MMPSPDRKRAILKAARAVPSPPRPVARRRQAILVTTSILLSGAVFWIAGGVRVTGRPPLLVLGTSLGLTLLAIGAFWLGVQRGRSMLGRPRSRLIALVALAPLATLLWKAAYTALFDGWSHAWPPRTGFKCLSWTLALAVAPLVVALFARRGSDPVHPTLTGAAIGTAIGVGTGVLVDLWCPVAYLPHLLLGHVLPIALLAAVGALVGSRTLGIQLR